MTIEFQVDDSAIRVAVAVIEHDGQFLIGRRPAGASLAGLWEFPGGKIQPGETPEATAQRECHEETGLRASACGRYATVIEPYAHGQVEVTFVACRLADAMQEARAPFRWVAAKELTSFQFPSANAELIRQLSADPPGRATC